MGDHTKIEWTDATWNPVTGCTLVSEGCRHCYAARWAATRLKHHPSRAGLARLNAAGEAKFTGEVRFNAQWLDQPLRWKRPKMIFVCAHGDLFHESVPDAWIDQVFAVMALAPQHTFQVLTKRPERMRAYLDAVMAGKGGLLSAATEIRGSLVGALVAADALGMLTADGLLAETSPEVSKPTRPLPNVWLGTSLEDQATADARIPHLLATPAAIRFISAEPLLGPVDLVSVRAVPRVHHHPDNDLSTPATRDALGQLVRAASRQFAEKSGHNSLDWVIVGGESGPGARPMHPDWARTLRDQCTAAGVPFFFKQWGSWAPLDDGWTITDFVDAGTRFGFLADDGRRFGDEGGQLPVIGPDAPPVAYIERVGTKAAGRQLDGIEHNGMPVVGRSPEPDFSDGQLSGTGRSYEDMLP